MSTLPTSLQHHTQQPSQNNKLRKISKNSIDWRGRNKTLFTDITMYIENPEESTKALPELMSELVRPWDGRAVYKINYVTVYRQ